jgi:hypothetical protein
MGGRVVFDASLADQYGDGHEDWQLGREYTPH